MGSDGKESACQEEDPALIPGWGKSLGEGKGNPLQYSCLENFMDRGAWQVALHGVTKKKKKKRELYRTEWLHFFTFKGEILSKASQRKEWILFEMDKTHSQLSQRGSKCAWNEDSFWSQLSFFKKWDVQIESYGFLLNQFSSVTQSCPTFGDPMDCSTPGLPVHHQPLEFDQTHVHQIGDAFQPPHTLLSPSPPALNLSQHHGLFQWVHSSHQVAKVLKLQLQHQSFQWIFRTDFL